MPRSSMMSKGTVIRDSMCYLREPSRLRPVPRARGESRDRAHDSLTQGLSLGPILSGPFKKSSAYLSFFKQTWKLFTPGCEDVHA